MAAAYGVRLAAIAFTAATLRGAVCGEPAGPCLTRALLAAGAAFAAGLAVGGLVGRLAHEQAARDAAAITAAAPPATAAPATGEH